jgi:hypothetical protein
MTTRKRFKCKFCGVELPAWLDVFQEPDGAMLLAHLSQRHYAESRAYVHRMRTTEDISPIAAEAFEVNLATLEQVFLPYAITENGQTVYERLREQRFALPSASSAASSGRPSDG